MTSINERPSASEPDSPEHQATPAPTGGLNKNAVSTVGATVMGVSSIGPIAGLAFLPQIVAANAGAATPFIYVIAVLGALCIAYTIAQFTRWVHSAGSFYAFNAKGLGPVGGVFSGWILMAGYALCFPLNMLSFGPSFSDLLKSQTGIDVPWWLLSLAAIGVIVALSIAGLGLSLRVDLTIMAAQLVIFLTLAVVIIVKGGDSGNTVSVFNPASAGAHSGGLLFGLVFAFLTCQGFESAATVAEETANPRRTIPRALIGTVLITGALFIFVTYAITIGFGVNHVDDLASDALPLGTLASRYISGDFATLVSLAIVFAAFSAGIATCNSLTRVLFAMGRDKVLPGRLAILHARRATPYVAVIAAAVLCVVITLGVGVPFGAYPEGYSYVGAITGIPFLLLYVMVAISLFLFVLRRQRAELNIFKHVVVPSLGMILAALAIYGSYHPLPKGAFLWINLGALVYAVAGVIFALYLKSRKPQLVAALNQVADDALD